MRLKNFSPEERISYFKQYGSHCIAYSTLQPGMKYFDIDGIGYVAYMNHGKTRFVLGDPICAEENKEKILEAALSEHKHTSFYQVSKSTAEILHKKFGFYMNVFGTETAIHQSKMIKTKLLYENNKENRISIENEINQLNSEKDILYTKMDKEDSAKKDFWKIKRKIQKLKSRLDNIKEENSPNFLDDFLSDPARSHIRRQYKSALQIGLTVLEQSSEDWKYSVVQEISSRWLSEMKTVNNEMKFFTRPIDFIFDKNNNVRLFVAKNNHNKIEGFLFLDPLYNKGEVFGYYADIIRVNPDAPSGTTTILLLESMKKIFQENKESYTLGLSPFHKIGKVHFVNKDIPSRFNRADNRLMTFLFRNIFDYGNFLYNAKDQAFHKERFNAEVQRTYCCSRKKFPLKEIIDGFRVSGVDPLKQFKSTILRKS